MTQGSMDNPPPSRAGSETASTDRTGPGSLSPAARAVADRPRLRLKAVDAEDLAVLSAQLQDAIAPVSDMAYLPDQRRFAMVVNRFMWECGQIEPHETEEAGRDGPICPLYLRTNCGVEFRQVTKVRSRGIDLRDRGQMLCLLALRWEGDAIDLHFSGGGAIRLSVSVIDGRVRDMDEPWPTERRPTHSLENESVGDGSFSEDKARA